MDGAGGASVFGGIVRTFSDQVTAAVAGMGTRQAAPPRRSKRSKHDNDNPFSLLDTKDVAALCVWLDIPSIGALQCTCQHLWEKASENEVWRRVCHRRNLRLVPRADDSTVNWKQIFQCFVKVWALPRIRGGGWAFSSAVEIRSVATRIHRMAGTGRGGRAKAVTILRRRTPAPEFWHWWLLCVVRGSKAAKAERAAPASSLHMTTRSVEVKREIRDAGKSKGRRVRVVLKSGSSAATQSIEVARRHHNTRAATSPPSAGTRSGPRAPRSPLRLGPPAVPRSPVVYRPPKSPASLPPRLPPRPSGPPAKAPTLARCSPFDYVTKEHLNMHLRALVSEASNSGVRVQQLRTLHVSLMKHQKNPHELFNIPVDPVALLIPDYEKVVKHPMDLGLIKRRLENGEYRTTSEYANDVRLVFDNAQRFNPLGHWINGAAAAVSQFFEEKLRRLESKCLIERQRQAGHSCGVCHGLTCRACGEGCLHFTPTALRCAGPCGMLIRRGSIYFYNEKEDAEICQRCFRRLNVSVRGAAAAASRAMGAGAAAEGGDGSGTDSDDDEAEEGSSMASMANIDKGSVADRSRKKITFIKDAALWTQDRWDPDWGEPEPWDQCACCLEVFHRGCGMHDPLLKDRGVFVCMFCRKKTGKDPSSPLPVGPEPSPTEMGTLRVDHSRTLPKAKGGGGVGARVRRRGQLVTGAAIATSDKTTPTPYSVPADTKAFGGGFPVPKPNTQTRFDASSLAETEMGSFVEKAIKDELHELGESSAAEAVVVRMVSSVDKNSKVNKHVHHGFSGSADGYAANFEYRSKTLFLFQRLDGIDVLLFVMYVQEYDADCAPPNQRQVYISYLDSVQYFRPRRLRTNVYHTLIVSYLEFVKERGFVGAHIWACPPLRSGSYIFCTRPVEQQVPTGQRLRAWYQQMLVVAQERGTCVGQTTMYDKYFENMGDPNGTRKKSKGGGQRKSAGSHKAEPIREFRWARGLPPYFEGDWWTLQGETLVKSALWQQPKRLLRQLMEHPANRQGLFNSPVDVSQVSNYLKVVKTPMDLGQIKAKLDKGGYKSPKDYQTDVRLVFSNAMSYNHKGHWVHDSAQQLLEHFEQRLNAPMPRGGRTKSPRDEQGGVSPTGGAGWRKRAAAASKGGKGMGRAVARVGAKAPRSPRGVVMQENPVGDAAPPPPETPPDVWHNLLQATATFLVGTRDEHIIAYMHWHCVSCNEPVEGKGYVVKNPPDAVEGTVPPCLCLCAECYEEDSSALAEIPADQIEEIDVELGDTSDPDDLLKPNKFVDVRNEFFEACQEDNFNFDTLRRCAQTRPCLLCARGQSTDG